MRVLVVVKASKESEQGMLPSTDMLQTMGKFNEDLANAGVLLAADGLTASSNGKRVRFDGSKRTVIDGPFAETKELVAGFWIWKVKSMDDAVEWLKKAPFGGGTEVEIRPIGELSDFGDAATPEIRDGQRKLSEKMRQNAAR